MSSAVVAAADGDLVPQVRRQGVDRREGGHGRRVTRAGSRHVERHHAGGRRPGHGVEEHPLGVHQGPPPGLADDRDRHPLDDGDDDACRGQPRVTSTDATWGSRATRARGGVDVDPQQRGPGAMPAASRTWSAGQRRARRRPARCGRRAPGRPAAASRRRRARPATATGQPDRRRRDRGAARRRPARRQRGHRRRSGPALGRGAPGPARAVPGGRAGAAHRSAPAGRPLRCRRRGAPRAPPARPSTRRRRPWSAPGRPGARARPAPGAAADQDGSNSTRPAGSGTASATSAPVTPGHRVLPGAVDVHHHDLVGQAQRRAEARGELLGPAVEVRLEGDHQPAARRRPRGPPAAAR